MMKNKILWGWMMAAALLFVQVLGGWAGKAEAAAASSTQPMQPKKVLVYYGTPQAVNGVMDDNKAAAIFAEYDFIVLGATLEETKHAYHKSTINIIKKIKELKPSAVVSGYVDLGVSTSNFTIEAMKKKSAAWKEMGINNIFLDDAGYDFKTPRSRLNTMVDYIHGLGLSVTANAWNIDDVLGNAVNKTYNPKGVATKMGANDYYLLESFAVNTDASSYAKNGGYALSVHMKARGDAAKAYRTKLGVKMLSVNIADFASSSDEQLNSYFKFAETAAAIFGLDGYGLNAVEYSSTGSNHWMVKTFKHMDNYSAYYTSTASYTVNKTTTEFTLGGLTLHNDSTGHWVSVK